MTRRTLWLTLAGLVVAAVAVGIVLRWADRPAPLPVFEEERAYALVSEQTDFGPRVPGTAAHDSARVWLQARLGVYADRVVEQQIEIPDPADTTRTFRGTNIVASWQPGLRRRILLAAHWDSRPIADNDPDPARRLEPVLGANDGASGVAVLLEIARLLDAQPLQRPIGVDIILFDLEDLGTIDPAVPEGDRVPFAMGSEMFVLHNPGYRPVWGVLLDMVGDTDLRIPKEGYSVQHAPELVDRIWAAARRVGSTAFLNEVGPAIQDDHVPFLRVGIPMVNLIQTPFPDTWHTTSDTPENVSAESLGQVGRVLVDLLWRPDAE
ncbi:MAG: hypothetical protein CMM84_15940 [Rhodothermaceae bacterium]|nr:hypothetical protein [Rhodothermaceae bacterium]